MLSILPPLTASRGNNPFCWNPLLVFLKTQLQTGLIRTGCSSPQCPLWAELQGAGTRSISQRERSANRTPKLVWRGFGGLFTVSKPSSLGRPVGTFIIVSPGYVSPVQEQDRLSSALPSLLPTALTGGWDHCFALLFFSKRISRLHLSQMHPANVLIVTRNIWFGTFGLKKVTWSPRKFKFIPGKSPRTPICSQPVLINLRSHLKVLQEYKSDFMNILNTLCVWYPALSFQETFPLC